MRLYGDNPLAKARGLSPYRRTNRSVSLVPWYPEQTLPIIEYLALKIRYLCIVVQNDNREEKFLTDTIHFYKNPIFCP